MKTITIEIDEKVQEILNEWIDLKTSPVSTPNEAIKLIADMLQSYAKMIKNDHDRVMDAQFEWGKVTGYNHTLQDQLKEALKTQKKLQKTIKDLKAKK